MQETTETARVTTTPGGGLGSVFGDDSIFAADVTIMHGVHRETAPPDQTVGELRRRYHDRLGLDENTAAFIGGRAVGDDERVRAGMTLTWMHRSGEKGRAA